MISSILDLIASKCNVSPSMEVTLEGNPTSSEMARLRDFRAAGINRMSLGIQALDNNDLRFFGRDHSVMEGISAARSAVELFDAVSLDFIWGRPRQSLHAWEEELGIAAALNPTHLSLYHLTVERGTPLFDFAKSGSVSLPNEDASGEMYERTVEVAEKNGYIQYEVSSFARDGNLNNRSRHNLSYWTGMDYIGIGPGAHGRLYGAHDFQRFRTFRILDPNTWMKQCEEIGHGMRKVVPMPHQQTLQELIVLGLRTSDGVDFRNLSLHMAKHVDYIMEILDFARAQDFVDAGLLEWIDGQVVSVGGGRWVSGIRPTRKGLAVVDGIVVEITSLKPGN
ncbi:uncharacterized protein SPPG_04334 [Spizellomyces punctatus DAOM BR117]|uniref:Elp3/MiaA/NifB-like radical SAM core domain-containing protein n=1 Tax=Spizellomyces punctatus (strain DAOM BR117) TaxID=645134 RepID=A0A0L0HJN6_SPIPD|nr:uncharacterized protein SPPG_04334 [Spizellomyces punctatus DAOM BR117]KND01243.1 hypothetical protein SPPG_04334 [Spizellomyces punctatus DAOM BR117]|eukprot:XP_016609282.1 hypothetical protein SPPG_04334 [Spizellomyces punctatus DAOM BR117]